MQNGDEHAAEPDRLWPAGIVRQPAGRPDVELAPGRRVPLGGQWPSTPTPRGRQASVLGLAGSGAASRGRPRRLGRARSKWPSRS
ncbi:MAG: hypothetical protein MZW92_72690 [Comamonadaceae bacterium]|nr:hypothetical protein [Comamonadaceae bacterium]